MLPLHLALALSPGLGCALTHAFPTSALVGKAEKASSWHSWPPPPQTPMSCPRTSTVTPPCKRRKKPLFYKRGFIFFANSMKLIFSTYVLAVPELVHCHPPLLHNSSDRNEGEIFFCGNLETHRRSVSTCMPPLAASKTARREECPSRRSLHLRRCPKGESCPAWLPPGWSRRSDGS